MPRLWMTRGDTDEFRENGLIRIAYGLKQDLSQLTDRPAIIGALTKGGVEPRKAAVAAGQLFRFAHGMGVGDRVISYDKARRIYLVGDVLSNYQFDPAKDPLVGCHVRRVKWFGEVSRDSMSTPARNTLGSLMTVFEPDDVVANDIDAALNGKPVTGTVKPTTATAAAANAVADDALELDWIRRDVDSRAQELIKDKIAALDWEDMQDLVAAILRAMGYKTRVSARGADRGRDILASPDGLGLSPPRIKVEVKHRPGSSMGAPDLRSFIGGLRGDDRGLYVSTGGFTREAQYEAERAHIPVSMLDLDDLAELLVQHYDSIDADGRALIPLKRVFFPA